MSSNNKMKGLLKGLRYISQIFDNEQEPEMQIGLPTDVKHVAHIGWDGPSVNSAPSWMNEFKAPPGLSSAPVGSGGEVREEDPAKWVCQDGSCGIGSRSQNSSPRDMPELPKSSKRSSSTNGHGTGESSIKEKPNKPRQPRKPSKNSSDGSIKPRKPKDPNQATDSTSQDLPGIPKKSSRRKKSKDFSVGRSSRGTEPRTWILDPSQGLYLDPERNGIVMLQVLKKRKVPEKINVGAVDFGW